MAESSTNTKWTRTFLTLTKLQQLLVCPICNCTLTNPSNLSFCEHYFCRDCIESVLCDKGGVSSCPICHIPSWIKDIHPNYQLNNLITLIESFTKMLSNGNNHKHLFTPNEGKQNASHVDEGISHDEEGLSHNEDGLSHDEESLSHDEESLSHDEKSLSHDEKSLSHDEESLSHDEESLSHDEESLSHDEESLSHDERSLSHDTYLSSNNQDDLIEARSTKRRKIEEVPNKGTTVRLRDRRRITKRNVKGETPLHVASLKGRVADVKSLLNLGADPNTQDNAGWTPLHEACSNGHKEIVRLLVESGAIVNVTGYHNNTPLHDAVTSGNNEIVKYLMDNGADTSIRNRYGYTPVDLAMTEIMKSVVSKPPSHVVNNELVPCVQGHRHSMCLIASGLNKKQKAVLHDTVASLGGSVLDTFNREGMVVQCPFNCPQLLPIIFTKAAVTHVVTIGDENMFSPRTIKTMSAIITGKWIMDYQWIVKCQEANEWLNEEKYEIKGLNGSGPSTEAINGPMNSRLASIIKKPGLFEGLEIYLKGVFVSPTKEELMSLIEMGEGKILTREPKHKRSCQRITTYPFHATPNSVFSTHNTIVISSCNSTLCDDNNTSNGIVYLPVSWILNSIGCYTLL